VRIDVLGKVLLCAVLAAGLPAVAAESPGDYGANLREIYFAHQRLLALREAFTGAMAMASALMLLGVAVLLKEHHAHWHRHQAFRHAHRHKHDPVVGDLHHSHLHPEGSPSTGNAQQGYWHAHEHQHEPIEHYHPHVSDAHHRHRHQQGL